MTSAEMEGIDLGGRMAFANSVANDVIPRAARSPGYAGAYIDQLAAGGLVVLLTSRDVSLEAELATLMPRDSLGLGIRVVGRSYEELRRAREEAWSSAVQILGTHVISTTIDERGNRLRIWVAAEAYGDATSALAALEAHLGAQVELEAGSREEPAACNSRNDCHTPFRSGIKITGPATCTMGFHIARNAAPFDLQFITTGHCGNGEWSHPGFGVIGSVLESESTATVAGTSCASKCQTTRGRTESTGRSAACMAAGIPSRARLCALRCESPT